MIIFVIVIVVFVFVGGTYMFNSSSTSDTNQTNNDYETQTYKIEHGKIKLDVKKQTKQAQKRQAMELSRSPVSSIFGRFLETNDDNTSVNLENSNSKPVVEEQQQEYVVNELIPFYRDSSQPLPQAT